ncbi:glycosyltransferase family 39 protein [Phaffia rhodozyma]|uniref:Dolichyl-phosphate-mannose--protein mannosyltransferase n=1 Tax=Phaffia rhodozyma TaxID=264483 RepID=A0A0F7SNL3_PHARH|nr:glycosyltransferase family 39 protein [Phaffia rhodozyma]
MQRGYSSRSDTHPPSSSTHPDLTFSTDYQDTEDLGLPLHHNPPSHHHHQQHFNQPLLNSSHMDINPVGGNPASRRRGKLGAGADPAEEIDNRGSGGGIEMRQFGVDGGRQGGSNQLERDRPGKERRVRPAFKPPAKNWKEFIENNSEHLIPLGYLILSMITRYWKIGKSNSVVWDEAHFGKFGSHYLRGEFYFDVHPPLGKMLVGLAGLFSGYDGSFDFKSGEVYPPTLHYTIWRMYMATYGVLMVPVGWYTARGLGWSRFACHLVTLMVLLDVGWLTISRFILLDSMLLLFTFTTVLGLVNFHNQQQDSFSDDWWLWLVFTGLSIGCVISVKWVGLFVTALVGLYTIEDLWDKFGDLSMPFRTYVRHWIARIVGFIIIPVSVYLLSFKLHFLILRNTGPGDSQMSSLFQANLNGNDFIQNPLEAAFGSKVTLKNVGYGGGLLHSHIQTYPVGSFQQQVTCYHYKDDNNQWVITPTWEADPIGSEDDIKFLQDGDIVRLVHAATGRNLHSHPVVAPVTKTNNEVSCYGNATIGDANDYWVIEVVDDTVRGKKDEVKKRIHSLTTRMRIRHLNSGCYIRAANGVLPQWGFKQIEVSCDKDNNPKDPHTYWNIESHWNERLPKGDAKLYKSPFFSDFWHLNVAMMTSNNALVPDPDKEDILASNPFDWPWLYLGLRMCGWSAEQSKYYLIGNPVVWWSGSFSLVLSVVVVGLYLFRGQRKYNDFGIGEWDRFIFGIKLSFGGWALHFLPFLIMGRVTYLHHYLPPLWFSVLMVGHLTDHFIFSNRRLTLRAKAIFFGLFAGAVILVFWWFKGVSFGIDGLVEDHWGLKWRKSWNIYN